MRRSGQLGVGPAAQQGADGFVECKQLRRVGWQTSDERNLQVLEIEQDVARGGVPDAAFDPADTGEAGAARDGADFVDGAGRIEDEIAGVRLGRVVAGGRVDDQFAAVLGGRV